MADRCKPAVNDETRSINMYDANSKTCKHNNQMQKKSITDKNAMSCKLVNKAKNYKHMYGTKHKSTKKKECKRETLKSFMFAPVSHRN